MQGLMFTPYYKHAISRWIPRSPQLPTLTPSAYDFGIYICSSPQHYHSSLAHGKKKLRGRIWLACPAQPGANKSCHRIIRRPTHCTVLRRRQSSKQSHHSNIDSRSLCCRARYSNAAMSQRLAYQKMQDWTVLVLLRQIISRGVRWHTKDKKSSNHPPFPPPLLSHKKQISKKRRGFIRILASTNKH